MSITCQVCGTINPDDAEFCEGCGVELSTAPEPAPPADASQKADSAAADSASVTPEPEPPLADVEAKPPEPTPPLADAEAKPPEPSSPAASQVPSPSTEPPATDPVPSPTTDTVAEPTTESSTEAATEPATEPTVGIDKPELREPQLPAEASAAPSPASVPEGTSEGKEERLEPPPSTPDTTPASRPARLHIKRYGAVTDDTIPLQGERLVVGRFDPSTGPVDIDVSGMSGAEHISRRHAELVFEDGRWKVRDLGSTNGVFVKRAQESSYSPRIQEPTPLADGDEIAFGNVVFVFRQGA